MRLSKRSTGLRPPKPFFERVKLVTFLSGYVAISEWSTPFPFYASTAAKLAVVALILLIAREFHHARQEVDEDWVKKTEQGRSWFKRHTSKISQQTWLKIQRVVTWGITFYAFGMVINTMTDRCSSNLQCAVLAPRLAAENLPQIVQFMILISLTLFQLGIMFYAMVKVGSYKLVMPGTVSTTFDDVFGQDEAKQKVAEQVALLDDSDEVEAAGGYMPKGILLYGPPGTGKTMLAQAAANYSSKPLILVPPGAFQAPQPLGATVYTPSGGRSLGSITEGDLVLGRDGLPHKVVKVKQMGVQRVWRLTFDDGAQTECAESHLWTVQNRWDRERPDERWRTVALSEILEAGLRGENGAHNWAFPLCEPAEFSDSSVPVHPYVLGVFLGDGCVSDAATTPILTVGDDVEILDRVESLLPYGCTMSRSPRADCEGYAYVGGQMKSLLRKAGIWGLHSHNKYIPDAYLHASSESRIELLRGLMDADGCSSNGYAAFSTISSELADDVVWLVRSLGGKANISLNVKDTHTLYQVHIALGRIEPFFLERKTETLRPRAHAMKRYLTDAELIGEEPVACLAIDSDDHLYLTDDFIVTHNTFVGIDLLKVWTLFREIRKLARRYGGVIVFMDEIDSLGSRGGGVEGAGASRSVQYERTPGCVPHLRVAKTEPTSIVLGDHKAGALQAFLAAMDGMEEPRGFLNRLVVFLGFKPLKPQKYKALFIGATNRTDSLDTALLRPGRFGRKIHVTYPKVDGRLRTYGGYLDKIQHELTPANVEWAARNHEKGTGAEIKDIVNEAVLISFRDDRDTPGVVTFDDLMHAMMWVKVGESEGVFPRERAKEIVAIHEAGHAVAFHALCRERMNIWFATIERHGDTGGMVAPTALDEDWLQTKEELMAELQVSLASRVAEELFLGTTTNGHGGDGQHATAVARKMVAYGHADTLGVYPEDSRKVQQQTEKILQEALAGCRNTIVPRRKGVAAVAKLLEEKGTVSGDEIHALLDGMGM